MLDANSNDWILLVSRTKPSRSHQSSSPLSNDMTSSTILLDPSRLPDCAPANLALLYRGNRTPFLPLLDAPLQKAVLAADPDPRASRCAGRPWIAGD